jgi:hypothetical protein
LTIFYYNYINTKKIVCGLCRANGVEPPSFIELNTPTLDLFRGGSPTFRKMPTQKGYTLSRALEIKDLVVYLRRPDLLDMFRSSRVLPDNDYFNLVRQSLSMDKDSRTLAGKLIHQLDYSLYGDYQRIWGYHMGYTSNSIYDDFHSRLGSIQDVNNIVNEMISYLHNKPLINPEMFIKTFNFVSDLFRPLYNKEIKLLCK